MPTEEKISAKSGKLELVSESDDIKINSNTYIHLGAKEGLFIDIGSVDGDNKPNKVRINSPRIEFGIPTQTKKLEPVVKGDQLELILKDILDLLNQIVSTPGAYIPQGQTILKTITQAKTEIIKQKLKKFKSKITYTT
jgi:hypothetical protein